MVVITPPTCVNMHTYLKCLCCICNKYFHSIFNYLYTTQVLSPRNDIGIYSSTRKKKKLKELDRSISETSLVDVKMEEHRDPALIVSGLGFCYTFLLCLCCIR